MEAIRFGGSGAISALEAAGAAIGSLPKTEEEFQQRYGKQLAARPPWVKAQEAEADELRGTPEGREKYGDPVHGATLPQAWRMQFAMTGFFKVCLQASGQPAASTDGIPAVVLIASADIRRALAQGFDDIEGFSAQLFAYDGRMGHAIALMGHNAGNHTFTYHDPWPEKSLLCREFNVKGVDAQPTGDGLWRITETELERVVFASFVMPTDWADLTGRTYRLKYRDLKGRDFWRFFHVRETGRQQEGARTRVVLQPGGFQSEIQLQIEMDKAEGIRKASLALRREWIVGPTYGIDPFAADIAGSFIGAFLPEPDVPTGARYVHAIANLRLPQNAKAVIERRGQPDLSAEEELQLTYLGLMSERTILLTYGRINARNNDCTGEACLSLNFDLY